MKNNKWMAVGMACALACGSLAAQEAEFDLSSQRSEAQNVLPVPGKKLNHEGIIINPTPQQIVLDKNHRVDISAGIFLKDKQNKFANDFDFTSLSDKGVKLSIDFGEKLAKKQGVKAVSGAYAFTINDEGIRIVGYDERGAYYGIQTLRQLVESPALKDGKLPYVEINDYPDLPFRGVVEGFYGTPWSHEVRKSLIQFYGKFKMNTYLYGPKDDPYHSSPNWRLPYPEKEAERIRDLVVTSHASRVDFLMSST